MRLATLALLCCWLLAGCGGAPVASGPGPVRAADAEALARELLILDTHIDLPTRLHRGRAPDGALTEDVSRRTAKGDFDYVRARRGGLDAAFMSIYIPARYEAQGGARALAEEQIDLVEGLVERSPERFALALSPAQVRRNRAAGRISLALGMENGSALEGRLANVAYFHGRGIRYVTLTHSKDNQLSDSSFDDAHIHGGLSPFGRQAVAEMNRVGIMIDVSHISDAAFWEVIELSRTPPVASHSSCRHFTPGWERNMSDAMIRALAGRGGVIQINFGSYFVDEGVRLAREARRQELRALLEQRGLEAASPEARPVLAEFYAAHPLPATHAERVADHIEHVIRLVGIDHVGLGSDFDGVGEALPVDLADVSHYPNLIRALLQRGYAPEQIEKIASGNLLRVWQAAQDYAAAARP